MSTVELTAAELRYLHKVNTDNLAVMEMLRQKGLPFTGLTFARQLQAKFAAVLPEGIPETFADLHPENLPNCSRCARDAQE